MKLLKKFKGKFDKEIGNWLEKKLNRQKKLIKLQVCL